MKSKNMLVLSVIIIAAVLGLAYLAVPVPVIDGIPCGLEGPLALHTHTHVDIFINSRNYTIPAGIGIIPYKCLYWMHTHDDTDVIHVESPTQRDFTLGEFFDIWGKAFNGTQIFDNHVSGASPLQVYENGIPAGDIRNIVLHEHDEIAVVYGNPPEVIPSSYAFGPGL